MDLNTHKVGQWRAWKFGINTREIYRINKNLFEINDYSNGWNIAIVTKTTLLKLYNGKKCILTLNWK